MENTGIILNDMFAKKCDAIICRKLSQGVIADSFMRFILKIWCFVTPVTPLKCKGVNKGVNTEIY
jgi:hypothetical protein